MPIKPYGRGKWMVEQLLAGFGAAYGLPSIVFRYFIAAGADPAGDLGEVHNPETHLNPLVLEAIVSQRSGVQVYGNDYPTPDGTCIRDYIHVCDPADAHVLGLAKLLASEILLSRSPWIYNLGNGKGYSVQEVLDAARLVTKGSLLAHVAPRRQGDPPNFLAGVQKTLQELGWKPNCLSLETVINHAWNWLQTA